MNSEYKSNNNSCQGLLCQTPAMQVFFGLCLVTILIGVFFALRMLFRFLKQRRSGIHKQVDEHENFQTVSKLWNTTGHQVSDFQIKTLQVVDQTSDTKGDITMNPKVDSETSNETDFKTMLAWKLEEYIRKGNVKRKPSEEESEENNGEKSIGIEIKLPQIKVVASNLQEESSAQEEKEGGETDRNHADSFALGAIDTEMFYDEEGGNDTVRVISDLTSPVMKENIKEKMEKVMVICD